MITAPLVVFWFKLEMQRLGLSQTLSQKLSPQQIQFIKLLQVPTAELDARIEEELEQNPALEEGKEEESSETDLDDNGTPEEGTPEEAPDIDVEDYIRDDEYAGYKMQGDGISEEAKDMPIPMHSSLNDALLAQLSFLGLSEKREAIG